MRESPLLWVWPDQGPRHGGLSQPSPRIFWILSTWPGLSLDPELTARSEAAGAGVHRDVRSQLWMGEAIPLPFPGPSPQVLGLSPSLGLRHAIFKEPWRGSDLLSWREGK